MTWPTVALRRLITCLDDRRIPLNSGERSEMRGDIPYWGAGGILDYVDRAIFDEPLVLLKEDGSPFFIPSKGVAYYVNGPAWVNNHIHALRPVGADGRFLAYALNCVDYSRYLTGSTRDKLTQEDLKKIEVLCPPLEEQQRIAHFLDGEVAKIDHLVAKKRLLITLLNERTDSRILWHVGGSELVDVSNGTPTLPIRRIISKVSRPAAPNVGVVTAYRDGQVTERNTRRAEGYTLSASDSPHGQLVIPGDVVVHGLDGFAGAIGASEGRGNSSPVYHVCVPRDGNDSRFIGRMLRLLALQGYLGNFATSTRERAVDFRNWDLFGRIPVPVVPMSEQREIGKWISEEHSLRILIERSSALAAERRQALITAAVTGQFDVSTASGRNVTDGVSA
ncbi:restriction endonuclease subunit S [Streptomyces sp. CJ_13]|uniref:restriction endonuclease subunit S n=1 Tax=Streptomyces sp. CJ_13 TaxID=2724943 RepID=UPI001BDBC5D6|nr:restriction endonuclease subunit S [Streptomyces sp. CJ_13]MBT1185559.1 restriction endonuclease subunit S [Streptomyces sp. CJ_13]